MFKMTKTSEQAGQEIHSLSKTNLEMHSSAISIPPKTDWLLRRKFPKEAETHLNRPYGWMCGIQFQEFRTADKLLHFLMTKSVAEMQTVHLSASGFLLTNDQQMKQMASLVSLLCKKLTELKNLSFGLHTLNTSDKGVSLFEEAIYQICRSLAQLKSLSITIDWCKDVDDNTLSFVASEITKYQKKLQKLSLSFSRNDDITNKGIEILANRITRRLIHLQELKFDFSYCRKVTDEGFIALITFISTYLPGLRRLELSFVRCENLTANGMSVFKSKIVLLVNLRELFLDFSWCKKVTGELDDLRTQVTKNLKALKRFELN